MRWPVFGLVALVMIGVTDQAQAAPPQIETVCDVEQALFQHEVLDTDKVVVYKPGFPKLRKSGRKFACRVAVDLYDVQTGGGLSPVGSCYRNTQITRQGVVTNRSIRRCR